MYHKHTARIVQQMKIVHAIFLYVFLNDLREKWFAHPVILVTLSPDPNLYVFVFVQILHHEPMAIHSLAFTEMKKLNK